MARAAKYWGLTPVQFKKYEKLEQSEMIAFYLVEQEIEGYYSSESAIRADRISKH